MTLDWDTSGIYPTIIASGFASLSGIRGDYSVTQTPSSTLVNLLDMSVTSFKMTPLVCIINEYF